MPTRPFPRDEAWQRTVSDLARAHGCPAGCDTCQYVREQAGVPGLLHVWEDFVRSQEALRLTRLCLRSGREFPRLSPDDVVQFCIEDACFERVALLDRIASHEMAERHDHEVAEEDLSPEHRAALDQARQFARTGVPA